MNKILLTSRITFKEGLRNKAMSGVFFIAFMSCFLYITIVPLFAFEPEKVIIDIGFASLTVAGLAIVLFLGISILTDDIHKKTICMIISRPISRFQYIIGKFLGLALLILIAQIIITSLAILFLWAGTILLPDFFNLPRNFSWLVLFSSIFLNYLSLLIILAISFFFTVVTTSSFLSMLLTFCIYVIGSTLETIVKVLTKGDMVQMGEVYLTIMKIISWIFPNMKAFNLKTTLSYGLPMSSSYLFWSIFYGIFYILIILFFTIFVFQHKDIK